MLLDVERIPVPDVDCSSILDTTQMPTPAVYMVDGKPLCRFCFEQLLAVTEPITS
jgi:hypothetical protein